MLIRQELKVEQDKVVLRNVAEDEPAVRAAREMSAGGTLQHVAMIPEEVYHFDPLCREYQRLRTAGNPEEARRVLRLFLGLNPQYRCSEARF